MRRKPTVLPQPDGDSPMRIDYAESMWLKMQSLRGPECSLIKRQSPNENERTIRVKREA